MAAGDPTRLSAEPSSYTFTSHDRCFRPVGARTGFPHRPPGYQEDGTHESRSTLNRDTRAELSCLGGLTATVAAESPAPRSLRRLITTFSPPPQAQDLRR